MEVLIIILLIIFILLDIFIVCCLKIQPIESETIKSEEKPNKVELSEEQKEKQEKLRKNFENLMGFDYEKALKSSKGE